MRDKPVQDRLQVGLGAALTAFAHPVLLAAGAGVGVCSSVIPYVTDQLAMARLPRGTYALMLALLPTFATIIGAIVLRQVPTTADLAGIGLVIAGVAVHQAPRDAAPAPRGSCPAPGPSPSPSPSLRQKTNWAGLPTAGKVDAMQVTEQFTVAAARAISSPVAAA